ncbi:uncharacterized protein LOC107040996 [Diachasma alloeum]|uniref:uncharacterized protein LOC107040996 n=1 Tax=Diachasma alloeum TaxID=454923 RepID=UPI0007382401|nr:uncharacterized protein LOC107040996 [Diachasma alloeum]
MPRLLNVKRQSSVNIKDNPESNKENINVHSKPSEEQDSPRMGQLREAFEKLTIDEKRPLRKRRALVRANGVDENIAVTKKNYKEKEMSKTRDDRERKKPVSRKKSRASSKADNNTVEKRKTINQAQNSSVPAKVTKKKPQHFSSEKKYQKQADVPSTSADSFPKIKDGGKSSRKKSIISIDSNNESSTKMMILKESSTIDNQTPAASVKPTPRSIAVRDNISIPTTTKITKNNPGTIKTEKKSTRKHIRNKTGEFELTKGKTVSWKINKTEVSSPSSNNETIPVENTRVPAKPEGIVNSKVDSPAVALVKREKPSPQSPIASVSVKLEGRGTPPATSTRILSAIDMNKYEKSTVNERGISNNKPGSKQELADNGNLQSTSGNLDVMKGGLKKNDECSLGYLPPHQQPSKEAPEAKLQVNAVGASKQRNSSKKDHRRQRKEKKVAKAFETLAARFVSTAKKMGYLDDSSEDSSTDDTGDSEHSTDCSCSSCCSCSSNSDDSEHSTECSCSSCTGTSSDYWTEYTVSGSSSTDYSDSSASHSDTSSSTTD